MKKMTKTLSENLKLFHDTMDQVIKYLIILDNELVRWNDLENEYKDYDDGEDWNKYRYYEMALEKLQDKKYKKDLQDSYGIKYIGEVGGYDDDGEPIDDIIIQIYGKFFALPYFHRHYFGELKAVKPVQRIHYIPID